MKAFSAIVPPDADAAAVGDAIATIVDSRCITQIPESVQMRIRSVTVHYRNDFSKTTQSFYRMNHCEHCGMKQGDFELFEEFDTPFCPSVVFNFGST
jgi:hypothetical protein